MQQSARRLYLKFVSETKVFGNVYIRWEDQWTGSVDSSAEGNPWGKSVEVCIDDKTVADWTVQSTSRESFWISYCFNKRKSFSENWRYGNFNRSSKLPLWFWTSKDSLARRRLWKASRQDWHFTTQTLKLFMGSFTYGNSPEFAKDG